MNPYSFLRQILAIAFDLTVPQLFHGIEIKSISDGICAIIRILVARAAKTEWVG
jgi:hypothetical protein